MALKLIDAAAQVPLSQIRESEQKVREETSDVKLVELMKSMVNNGQIHAVSLLKNDDGTFEIIDGHRRVAAARLGNFPSLQADIYTDLSATEVRVLFVEPHSWRYEVPDGNRRIAAIRSALPAAPSGRRNHS